MGPGWDSSRGSPMHCALPPSSISHTHTHTHRRLSRIRTAHVIRLEKLCVCVRAFLPLQHNFTSQTVNSCPLGRNPPLFKAAILNSQWNPNTSTRAGEFQQFRSYCSPQSRLSHGSRVPPPPCISFWGFLKGRVAVVREMA